jgi:putative endonuclease
VLWRQPPPCWTPFERCATMPLTSLPMTKSAGTVEGMSEWSVYMVRAGDGSLYTGVATDVDRRFGEHSQGGPRAARYLRGRGPLELLYQARLGGQGLALRVEGRLKRLDKAAKEGVASTRPDPEVLLSLLGLPNAEEEE